MKTTSAIFPVRFTAAALVLLVASAASAQDTGAPATDAEAGASPTVAETAPASPSPTAAETAPASASPAVPEAANAPASALTDAPGADTAVNPHKMMGELSGGPLGTPTATRGNPQPGTSTAIPTLNPTPVFPLGNPTGAGNWIGDTGIEGQCDPSISFEDCAKIVEELKDDNTTVPTPVMDDAEVLDAEAAKD